MKPIAGACEGPREGHSNATGSLVRMLHLDGTKIVSLEAENDRGGRLSLYSEEGLPRVGLGRHIDGS